MVHCSLIYIGVFFPICESKWNVTSWSWLTYQVLVLGTLTRHPTAASHNTCRNYQTTDNSPGMALNHGKSVISQADQHLDGLDQGSLHLVYPSLSYQSCYSNTADQHLLR